MKKLLLSSCVFLAGVSAAHAQMPGWSGIEPLTITENSGVDLYNYQLEYVFDSEIYVLAGEMSATGDDLRFTSSCTGGTIYNYWIESGMNTPTTTVWIRIDTLLANSSKTIYMQFDNPSASAVSAVNGTFLGPHSATDSVVVGAAGGVANSQRGFRFSPNEDILVTSFGKNEPNGTTRYITLFDFATQGIVGQTQVAGPASVYSYGSLTAPIWLTQGTQYTLQLFQGASDGYFYGTSSQIGQHLTYLDMRYCNSCTQNTFPTNVLSNYHYGFPDLWYYTKNTATVVPSVVPGSAGAFSSNMIDNLTICEGDTVYVGSILNGEYPYSYTWTGQGIVNPADSLLIAAPSNNGTYYLEAMDACGNIVNDSVSVTLNALPVVTIQTTGSPICYGDDAILSITPPAGAGVLWSDGLTTTNTFAVSPTSLTTYSVTVTSVEGCVYEATFDQDVYPMIDATVTASNPTATLTANATGATYQWVDCNNGNAPVPGATGAVFMPAANGSYAVEVTINGCTETSICNAITTVSLLELGNDAFVQVVPNPNNGTFEIRSSVNQEFVLSDATGKQLQTIEVLGGVAKQVQLERTANGIYFLSAGNKVVRIVVQ